MLEDTVVDLPRTWQPAPALERDLSRSSVSRADAVLASHASLWNKVSLPGLLGVTAVLYLWNLAASGWANAYYSAAALAGSQDWLAFFFGSFDAGNAITVDKTPASLWVMSLSVRLFGLNSWSLLVPQALMGVASVGLLYLTVARTAGRGAGLLAGAVLALTPVATLMFRFNNPDALLVLLLVGAAYATTRALEAGSTKWLVLAGFLVGSAFLAKMLQAFLVIPAFTVVYLWAAPGSLPRRIAQVGAAAVAVVVSAGWYVAVVELWPAASRPFIGGSQSNSIVELLLGYNGLGRLTGEEVGRVGGGGPFSDGVGLLRLFEGELAGEASWLIPAALIVVVGTLIGRRVLPRTDPIRAQAVLWGGWLVVTGLVFSLMAGIFHEYYTVALAPAIGALIGIGAAQAWRARANLSVRLATAATVVISAWWAMQILAMSPSWNPWLSPVLVVLAVVAAAGIVAGVIVRSRLVNRLAMAAGVVAILLAPGVASVATAATPHTGALPTADPVATLVGPGGDRGGGRGPFNGGFGPQGGQNGGAPGFGPGGGQGGFGGGQGGGGLGGLLDASEADSALVAALRADAGSFTWAAATTGANNAAGLSLSSETSVMAIGGFNGSDPAPTLEQFQAYVAEGRIHYYVATRDAGGFRGTQGGSDAAAQISAWVAATFTAETVGGVTVYDLSGD